MLNASMAPRIPDAIMDKMIMAFISSQKFIPYLVSLLYTYGTERVAVIFGKRGFVS